jgi:hypothetical protein
MKAKRIGEALVGFVVTVALWIIAPAALLFWVLREPFEPRRKKDAPDERT